ncbi:MAG TPA: NAD(P)-dependent oxidoreductase [Candidatus Krumholzibacteriaceae bacterium]|nr:NAD(P)-dependent oxidoreductase [Candidatus Krumholzibacteriaceae bacterium]
MTDKYRIITSGRLARDFHERIKEYAEAENICIDYFESIDQETLNEYNALTAFTLPRNLDISHILWIHSFGAGADAFLERDDLNEDIIISRTVGNMGRKMAEYCLAHILAEKQNLYELYKQQKSGVWRKVVNEKDNKNRIAVLGTGNMGREVARLLSGFGFELLGVNTDGRETPCFVEVYPACDFLAEPPEIDILISTLPAAGKNENMLSGKFFSNFKNLHFINVGRGGLVEEKTILDSIEKGYISRATLDVFSSEPLPASSRLWMNDSVYITPHQAALTDTCDIEVSFKDVFESLQKNQRSEFFIDTAKGY